MPPFPPAGRRLVNHISHIRVAAQVGAAIVILVHQPVKVEHSQPGPQAGIANDLTGRQVSQPEFQIPAGFPAVGKIPGGDGYRRLHRLGIGDIGKNGGRKGRIPSALPQRRQVLFSCGYALRRQLAYRLGLIVGHNGYLRVSA